MPVLIDDDLIDAWLDPASDAEGILDEANRQGAELSARLSFHTVASPKGDGPHLIEPDDFTLRF